MMKSAALIFMAVLLGSAVLHDAECAQYQIFTPRPLEGEIVSPEKGKGILVERITIMPGDTLSKLSRKFSGKSHYFPQILLFNDIHNPDLIYAGKELYIPVSKQVKGNRSKAGEEQLAKPVRHSSVVMPAKEIPKTAKPALTNKTAGSKLEKNVNPERSKTSVQAAKDGKDAYSKALNAYRSGDYSVALTGFEQFLAQYPESSLTPDASLYKAECLLKLSGE